MPYIIESLDATRSCSLSPSISEQSILLFTLMIHLTSSILMKALIRILLLLHVVVPSTSACHPTVSIYTLQLLLINTAPHIALMLPPILNLIVCLILIYVLTTVGKILDPRQHVVVLV